MSRIAAMLFLCGCIGNNATDSVSRPSSTVFYVDHVHPMIESSCATLDCHGEAKRPLRIYSNLGLRAFRGTSIPGDDSPLSELEIHSNLDSLFSIDPPTRPEQNLLLLKPLAKSGGGVDHVGGNIWNDRDADGFRCLLSLLDGSEHADVCRMR